MIPRKTPNLVKARITLYEYGTSGERLLRQLPRIKTAIADIIKKHLAGTDLKMHGLPGVSFGDTVYKAKAVLVQIASEDPQVQSLPQAYADEIRDLLVDKFFTNGSSTGRKPGILVHVVKSTTTSVGGVLSEENVDLSTIHDPDTWGSWPTAN